MAWMLFMTQWASFKVYLLLTFRMAEAHYICLTDRLTQMHCLEGEGSCCGFRRWTNRAGPHSFKAVKLCSQRLTAAVKPRPSEEY